MFDDDDRNAAASHDASSLVRTITTTLAAILTLASISWALDLHRRVFGFIIIDSAIVAALLGICFALVFLHVPASGGQRRSVPWYDWIAAIAGLGVGLYIAVRYKHLYDSMAYITPEIVAISLLVTVLTLEGLRRVTGNALLIICSVFIVYGLLGYLMPSGPLQAAPIDWRDFFVYAIFDINGLIGPILGIALTVVISFLFFGALLSQSGGADFFNDISMALMGKYRGGSAKITIVSSALFGTISGSALANVVSSGVITIPLMKKAGYKATDAGGIEAVSSTGGQLMPPVMGAAAFLMAEFLETTYATIVLAAIIPSALFYLALFFQADLEAAKNKILAVEAELIPRAGDVMKWGGHFLISFAVLIYTLFWWNVTAEMAAIYGCGALMIFGALFGYRGRKLTWRGIVAAVVQTGFLVISIALIAAAGGIIVATLGKTGLSFSLPLYLIGLGGSSIIILLLIAAAISIVLGMGMPTVAVYVLLATLIVPSLIQVGIEPLAAHMFALYFGMLSMITPPVAIAAYGAAAIAKADPVMTALAACRFGWPSYIVPFLFVFSPELLMVGEPLDIVWVFLTAMIGVWVANMAVVGYFYRPLSLVMRVIIFVGGVLTLIPSTMFPGAIWTDVAGLAISVVALGWEFWRGKLQPAQLRAAAKPVPGE